MVSAFGVFCDEAIKFIVTLVIFAGLDFFAAIGCKGFLAKNGAG